MKIKKATEALTGGVPTEAQLGAINAQARAKLTPEQVYVFSLRLCDDQIDRDGERFDTAALSGLAKLFIGKTGILDHRWSSDSQVARIFATEVVREERVSYIKAWAYIRRGGAADEIIADIEAGIKKEVSVGCAMGRAVCSICGSDYGTCGHQKGEYYNGQLCCAILKEPMDAYEFSFVAVPAQPEAGVLKGLGNGKRSLKELAEQFGAQAEYRGCSRKPNWGRNSGSRFRTMWCGCACVWSWAWRSQRCALWWRKREPRNCSSCRPRWMPGWRNVCPCRRSWELPRKRETSSKADT